MSFSWNVIIKSVVRSLVRWGAYPVVFGGCAMVLVVVMSNGLPYWPLVPLIPAAGIACVALLERLQPYEAAWLSVHGDTGVDILHACTSLTLISMSAEAVGFIRRYLHLPAASLWPAQWPMWAQVLLAGAIINFGCGACTGPATRTLSCGGCMRCITVREERMPDSYLAQMTWPWQR